MAIQPKKFRYTLDIRGVEEDILFSTPDGWLQTNIKYARSKAYGGVIRSLTLPIKYVLQGAYLVRREFYKYGLLARVNQYIYKQDPATWLYVQLFFGKIDFSKWSDEPTGVTVNLTENNINVQVAAFADVEYAIPLNVNTTARNAWIASRGYDPMVDILLTPLQLEETADLIFNTSPDFRMNAFFEMSIADYQQMSVNASVQNVGFFQQGHPTFANLPNYFFKSQIDNNKIRIHSPLNPVTGDLIPGGVQTSINGPSGGGTGQYQFNIYKQDGTLLKTLAQSPPVVGTVEFTFSFDFSLQLNKDDKLYFYILNVLNPTLDDGIHHGVNMQSGSMSLTYFTSTPASHCQALRPAYIFDYLVQIMNGTENPAVETQSFLLEGPLYQAAITCSNAILTSQVATIYQAGDSMQIGSTYKVFGGIIHYVNSSGAATNYGVGSIFKAILGHPSFTTDADEDGFVQQENNNPQLIYSFNSFFRTFFGVQCAQVGVGLDPGNGKYCLEDLRYFYRSTGVPALDLGENIDINSPKNEVNLDVAANTINIGYKDPQLTALNGGQEVNSSQQYATLSTSPSKVLDCISPTNASCYVIEEKRIQPGFQQPSSGLSGTFYLNSAASRSDNDNHFVWVKSAPEAGHTYYTPLTVSEGTLSYSGVDGSYYNWMLTPKQNLLRGRNYLASIFDKMGGQMIYLTSAPKNSSLVTVDLTGRRVAEGEAVNISDLGPQIFLPYYDNITTGLQFNAETLLSMNPFGEIWYKYRGVVWKAFIEEISVDEGENSPQSFKVKLTPANDMSLRVF